MPSEVHRASKPFLLDTFKGYIYWLIKQTSRSRKTESATSALMLHLAKAIYGRMLVPAGCVFETPQELWFNCYPLSFTPTVEPWCFIFVPFLVLIMVHRQIVASKPLFSPQSSTLYEESWRSCLTVQPSNSLWNVLEVGTMFILPSGIAHGRSYSQFGDDGISYINVLLYYMCTTFICNIHLSGRHNNR